MPASCVIPDCNLKYTHTVDVSFHKFPFKHPELLKEWIQFTGRDERWVPTKWSAICSRHFVASDFKDCPFRKMLLATAVPSIRRIPEKVDSADEPLAATYDVVATDELPLRDEDYLRGDVNGSSIIHCSIAGPMDMIDDDLQEEEFQLTEITCRICGVVFSRTMDNLLCDLSPSVEVVARYLPFVNLDLPNLPRKICLNCSKVINGFSKFCDNVLRAQTDLEHRFMQGNVLRSPTPSTTSMAIRAQQEAIANKPMNIKQEPVTMLHIKEEKVEYAIGGNRPKENVPRETQDGSPLFIKKQCIAEDQNRIILLDVGNECAAETVSATPPEEQQQPLRETSKNCEILEIVNLYPPIVDITSATITEVQPYEITGTAAERMPSVQQSTISAQFMSGLKVEKMTEQECEQDDYYLQDTLALINTLEEHSYTKLPIQADDNKDEVFHGLNTKDTKRWVGSVAVTSGERLKIEAPTSARWVCADCGMRCSLRRRLLVHRTLQCPARRKPSISCKFCRHKFASWHRARAHVAVCLKRTVKRKRSTCKSLDRTKLLSSGLGGSAIGKLSSQEEVVMTRYACSMCDRSYKRTATLRRHLASHRPQEQWNHKCGVCLKIFDKLVDLKRHLQFSPCANGGRGYHATDDDPVHYTAEELDDVECSGAIVRSVPVITATKPVADRLLYVCSTCNKHFRSYNNLKVHEPIHTGIKAYICETCGKRFTGPTNLWQHRLTHSELRQFRCKLCPKVFKRRGGLSQHVRAYHMKIKPYRCNTCGYEYALKADMTRCRHSRLKYLESC